MRTIAICIMFVGVLSLTMNSVDAAWGISAPVNNAGDRQENRGDLQTWGEAPVGATIRVEVWRDGTKIDQQIIGPLPAQPSSGGGGGWWWANFAPPSGQWNGTYFDRAGEIKLYDQGSGTLMATSSFIFSP